MPAVPVPVAIFTSRPGHGKLSELPETRKCRRRLAEEQASVWFFEHEEMQVVPGHVWLQCQWFLRDGCGRLCEPPGVTKVSLNQDVLHVSPPA